MHLYGITPQQLVMAPEVEMRKLMISLMRSGYILEEIEQLTRGKNTLYGSNLRCLLWLNRSTWHSQRASPRSSSRNHQPPS